MRGLGVQGRRLWSLGSALRRIIRLNVRMNTTRHEDSKTYGTHFLDSIIGGHKHLDHALYAFRHVDAKNYGAYHLDFIIGDLEHLNYTLETSDRLGTKTTRRAT